MKKFLKIFVFISFVTVGLFLFVVSYFFTTSLPEAGVKYSQENAVRAIQGKDYPAALQHIKAGISVAPKDTFLNVLLAEALYRSGNKQEALLAIDNGMKISESNGDKKLKVGMLLLKAMILDSDGKKEEAALLTKEVDAMAKQST